MCTGLWNMERKPSGMPGSHKPGLAGDWPKSPEQIIFSLWGSCSSPIKWGLDFYASMDSSNSKNKCESMIQAMPFLHSESLQRFLIASSTLHWLVGVGALILACPVLLPASHSWNPPLYVSASGLFPIPVTWLSLSLLCHCAILLLCKIKCRA